MSQKRRMTPGEIALAIDKFELNDRINYFEGKIRFLFSG